MIWYSLNYMQLKKIASGQQIKKTRAGYCFRTIKLPEAEDFWNSQNQEPLD